MVFVNSTIILSIILSIIGWSCDLKMATMTVPALCKTAFISPLIWLYSYVRCMYIILNIISQKYLDVKPF